MLPSGIRFGSSFSASCEKIMSSLGSGLLGLDSEKLMLGIKPACSLISILCNACGA